MSSALLLLSLLPAMHPIPKSEMEIDVAVSSVFREVVISEFYPRALCKDEYFALASLSESVVNLRNWSITDGEGTVKFTNNTFIAPAEVITISMNMSSFQRAYDRAPSFAIDSPDVRQHLSRSGTFALADSGDSISLIDSGGYVADFIGYGDSAEYSPLWHGALIPSLRQGEIAKRIVRGGVYEDTDCATDWMTFREFKYGYTEMEPLVVRLPAGRLAAFTSPDCSLDVVVDAVRCAGKQIRICSYEFSSLSLTRSLLDALDRGVLVRILVDGSPAGGMDKRQIECLSFLESHGAEVLAVNGNLSLRIVQHVGAMHAKYMVVDSSKSLILSENFVESGIPEDRVFANRGWGVMIDDESIARYLGLLYDSDARLSRIDVKGWREDARYVPDAALPAARMSNHTSGMLAPFKSKSEATITIIPSPDGSPAAPYLESFLSDSSELRIEQFQVDLYWQNRWTAAECLSPLLEGVVSGMRQGAYVRMLMDSSWFNSAHNELIVTYLDSLAKNESLAGFFRCLDPRSPISVIHNKGAILDHRLSLVSSNNWCMASFARNRELGAIIDSSETAEFFEAAFELDWEPDLVTPNASAGSDLEIMVGQTVVLDGSGSSDDRAVVDWRWDLDSDGEVEASGSQTRYSWSLPGTHRVTLFVEDAWGNRDDDEVVVRVLPYDGADSGSSLEVPGTAAFATSLTGVLSALAGVLLARRRARHSRKFNHADSD